MGTNKVKGYCAPKCGDEGLGEMLPDGFFLCQCGCKTKIQILDEQQTAALNDFVNGREYGVQEIGRILTNDEE